MINLGQYAFWPYMHRETLRRAGKCKSRTEIGENFSPTHQKGRRVPTNLHPLENSELKKLIDEKHILKLNGFSDKKM